MPFAHIASFDSKKTKNRLRRGGDDVLIESHSQMGQQLERQRRYRSQLRQSKKTTDAHGLFFDVNE